jgi:hypothetical protein
MAGLEAKPIPSSGVEKSERRFKILSINYAEAIDIFLAVRWSLGQPVSIVECDLPKGVRVRHVRYCAIFDSIEFLLEHPTFPMVPEGQEPPRIEVKYWLHEIDPEEHKRFKTAMQTVIECPDCSGSGGSGKHGLGRRNCETCKGKREVVALILGPAE